MHVLPTPCRSTIYSIRKRLVLFSQSRASMNHYASLSNNEKESSRKWMAPVPLPLGQEPGAGGRCWRCCVVSMKRIWYQLCEICNYNYNYKCKFINRIRAPLCNFLKFLLSIAFVVPHIGTKFRWNILRNVGDIWKKTFWGTESENFFSAFFFITSTLMEIKIWNNSGS